MAEKVEVIQTERLTLRGICDCDANEIVEWRSDPEVYKYFKSPHKITIEEHLLWYKNRYLKNEDRLDWMIIEKETGRKTGVVGLVFGEDNAEVNYLLAPEVQHRGYAKEAITALIAFARDQRGVHTVTAEIHKDNEPSIRFIRKLGFQVLEYEGDYIIYHKTEE